MGITIEIYRARVGLNDLKMKPKYRARKYQPYKGYHNETDIHLRCFVVGVFLLVYFGLLYTTVMTRVYIENKFAANNIDTCSTDQHGGNDSPRGTIPSTCPVNGVQYLTFSMRILLLSADVELNPGPTEDTEMILRALSDIKTQVSDMSQDMSAIRSDVKQVKAELKAMKTDINLLRTNMSSIEEAQKETISKMSSMEVKVVNLEHYYETMNNDIGALSFDSENQINRIEAMEKQIEMLEADRLKDSLRLFGIDEQDDNIKPIKTIIHDKVFAKMDPNDRLDIDAVLHARRVGTKHGNNARVIIVKLKNPEDKFTLFKYRDILRQEGIRISNDLTYTQRQTLKDVKNKGMYGYFKGHKLITYPKSQQPEGERIFRRAVRRSTNANPNATNDSMEVVDQTSPKSSPLKT